MNEPIRQSDLDVAADLVFKMVSHLEEASRAYGSLVGVVGELDGLTQDEIAVRLNVSLRHARLIVDGATFEGFLAALLPRDAADDQLPTADGL